MAAELLSRRTSLVTAVPAVVVVMLQIAYPLVRGVARDRLTVAVVIVLAGACVVHAAVSRGARTAVALLAVTAVPGFVAEIVGVHTDVPFGGYSYASSLGPTVLGVPPVIGLAWTMLAWPAAVAARRLATGRAARIVVGAWALASADLFLDPQMVAAGHWTWQHPAPHLPGVDDVPLTNYAGWLAVAVVMSAGVQMILDAADADIDTRTGGDTVMILLYLWMYVGWIVALGVFLDLRAAAVWGALGMGVVAVPLLARLRGRPWRSSVG